MSDPSDKLDRAERIEFWQTIENRLREALRQCERVLSSGADEEISIYLDHNELGLAWESFYAELNDLACKPPVSFLEIIQETGVMMGFNKKENQSGTLWNELKNMYNQKT